MACTLSCLGFSGWWLTWATESFFCSRSFYFTTRIQASHIHTYWFHGCCNSKLYSRNIVGVCMYVCMHICMYYVCMSFSQMRHCNIVCMYVCMYVCKWVKWDVLIVWIWMLIWIISWMYVCIYVCMYINGEMTVILTLGFFLLTVPPKSSRSLVVEGTAFPCALLLCTTKASWS